MTIITEGIVYIMFDNIDIVLMILPFDVSVYTGHMGIVSYKKDNDVVGSDTMLLGYPGLILGKQIPMKFITNFFETEDLAHLAEDIH